MSSRREGGESPPPETQTDAQTGAPGSAGVQGEENKGDRKQNLEQERDNLESNPKGVLDDEVTRKFAKDTKT